MVKGLACEQRWAMHLAQMSHKRNNQLEHDPTPLEIQGGSIFTNILVPLVNYLDYEGNACVKIFS